MTGTGKITEREFMAMVIELAKLHQWRVAHFRPGMNRRGEWQTAVQGDGVGFPDAILVRNIHCLAIELKTGKNKTTPEQDAWLAAFDAAGIYAAVWRPDDWKLIEAVLKYGPIFPKG